MADATPVNPERTCYLSGHCEDTLSRGSFYIKMYGEGQDGEGEVKKEKRVGLEGSLD